MIKLFVLAASLLAAATSSASADCTNIKEASSLVFQGVLRFQIFPGPPNYEDVREGDRSEPAYILDLQEPVCAVGDDDLDANETFDEIHLYTTNNTVEKDLRRLLGSSVTVTGVEAFARHTAHHRAPLVVRVGAVQKNEAIKLAGASAVPTVRGFYQALAAGDGKQAAQFVAPKKRAAGPLSAAAISEFYRDLPEPLRLISVRWQNGVFRVHYRYRAQGKPLCAGRADVYVVNIGGLNLIEKIKVLDGC